jgi:hypothetical protein
VVIAVEKESLRRKHRSCELRVREGAKTMRRVKTGCNFQVAAKHMTHLKTCPLRDPLISAPPRRYNLRYWRRCLTFLRESHLCFRLRFPFAADCFRLSGLPASWTLNSPSLVAVHGVAGIKTMDAGVDGTTATTCHAHRLCFPLQGGTFISTTLDDVKSLARCVESRDAM